MVCFLYLAQLLPYVDTIGSQIMRVTIKDVARHANLSPSTVCGHNSPFVRELAHGEMPIVELNRQREKDILDAVLPEIQTAPPLLSNGSGASPRLVPPWLLVQVGGKCAWKCLRRS